MRALLLVISTFSLAVALGSAQGDDLPEGKGKDVFLRMCTNCHEPERATSARNSKRQWEDIVDDMVSRGAEGSDDDAEAVVSYLSRNFGKPVNINSATAQEITQGLSFPTDQSEAIVKYRTDNGAFKTLEDVAKVPGLDAGLLDEQKKNIVF